MSNSIPLITIDGTSGVGKSTVSGALAMELSWNYLNSGALYRVCAVHCLKREVDHEELLPEELSALVLSLPIACSRDRVTLDGEDVTETIRTEDCGLLASKLAARAEVREALLQKQRAFLQAPGLIAEGRDMGTVVFPDSPLKIFLTATNEIRGQRRYEQLKSKGMDANLDAIIADLDERDERDKTRNVAPLVPAEDALIIDTGLMSAQEVIEKILAEWQHRQS